MNVPRRLRAILVGCVAVVLCAAVEAQEYQPHRKT